MLIAKNIFFFLLTDCFCFVISLLGEVTEDELFSRLQQIKDGPEQQNNTPSVESGEDPVGKFAFSYSAFSLDSYSDVMCHLLTLLIFRPTGKL